MCVDLEHTGEILPKTLQGIYGEAENIHSLHMFDLLYIYLPIY